MHKALYRENLGLAEARAQIAGMATAHPQATDDIAGMVAFLDRVDPGRGIVR